jgi:hypothetical protein
VERSCGVGRGARRRRDDRDRNPGRAGSTLRSSSRARRCWPRRVSATQACSRSCSSIARPACRRTSCSRTLRPRRRG